MMIIIKKHQISSAAHNHQPFMKAALILCLVAILCNYGLMAQSQAYSERSSAPIIKTYNGINHSNPSGGQNRNFNSKPNSVSPNAIDQNLPVENFKGIYDITNTHPSDTHGAVGPNDVMGISNLAFEILDKNGNIISAPEDDSVFFDPLKKYGVPCRDGRLTYDPFGRHWIFILLYAPSQNAVPVGFFIAISTTDDPTGSWNMWAIPTTKIDYPTLGFNENWICVGTDLSSKLFVFDKPYMYSHHSDATPSYVTLSNISGIWQPCVTLDSNQNILYLVETEKGRKGSLDLAKISGASNSPSFSYLPDVHSSYTWTLPGSIKYPQKGTNTTVTSGGKDGIMNAIFINNTLWCTNCIGLTNPTRAGVLWWQINPAQSSLIQVAMIQDSTGVFDYCSPSIIADSAGNALIGFSVFSKTCYASSAYVVHHATGDSGHIIHTYFGGLADYKNPKWGDYSHSCIDPADHSFWTVQSYTDANGDWATRWANINLNQELKTESIRNVPTDIHLYPNPSQNKLTVTLPNHDPAFSIDILNSDAEYVSELKVAANETEVEINTSDFPTGIYFLQFKSSSGNRLIKFEVRH